MAASALTVTGLSKAFDGVKAVNDLSLTVEPDKITALIGPNGSGKTTLLNLISGLLRPDRGQIKLGDRVINSQPPHVIARLGVARTFQHIRLFPQISVRDNLMLALSDRHDERLSGTFLRPKTVAERETARIAKARELLETIGLASKESVMGWELSHGQRRLLEIARTLALRPSVLLLDEPMAGLSPSMIALMKETIRSLRGQGRTILFVEHNVKVVLELSDHVIVLDHGAKIAEGTPDEIRENPRVIEAYLGGGLTHA